MATDHKTTILLDKKDVVLVRPAEATPEEVLSFSTLDNQYSLQVACQTLYVYNRASSSSSDDQADSQIERDPALVVKEALSKALVYYYPLAGKLKRETDGRLQITCKADGDGVPFLEATTNSDLSSFNYFFGSDCLETAMQLAFGGPTDHNPEYGSHPLVLQVTKFSCGGFAIGMQLSHSVVDGFGAGMFFRTMVELASGKIAPTVKPVWEREMLVGQPIDEGPIQPVTNKASFVTSPFFPAAAEVSLAIFDVEDESIRKLKMYLTQELYNNHKNTGHHQESHFFTTVEVLGAYIWRSRYRALRQSPNGRTILKLITGIRKAIKPPLPAGYYGNCIISTDVEVLGKDLDDEQLCKVAMLIKEGKKAASKDEHIWKTLNALEKCRQENSTPEGCGAGESLILSDWRRLRLLDENDFGCNSCVNMVPLPRSSWLGYRDLCIFTNPPTGTKGGVRIYLSLPRAAMERFKDEMDALKHAE